MKNKRRDFLKLTGMAGIGMAGLGVMNRHLSEPDYTPERGIEKQWLKIEKLHETEV